MVRSLSSVLTYFGIKWSGRQVPGKGITEAKAIAVDANVRWTEANDLKAEEMIEGRDYG